MMSHLDWGRTCFAGYGHYTYPAFPSKSDQIMSKYKPIAPKPSPQSPNPCKSHSSCNSVLDSRSRFNSLERNNDSKASRPRRTHGRPSVCSNSHLPRGQKRAKGPNSQMDLTSKRSHIVGCVAGSITADESMIVYAFDGSVGANKITAGKDSGVLEKALATTVAENIVSDKKSGVYGGLDINAEIESIREVGIYNLADQMEVPMKRMPAETEYCCGARKCFSFPIDTNMEQDHEKNGKNLVTLQLLPQTPCLSDSVLGSCESNSFVGNTDLKSSMPDASSDEKEFEFILFGQKCKPEESWPLLNQYRE